MKKHLFFSVLSILALLVTSCSQDLEDTNINDVDISAQNVDYIFAIKPSKKAGIETRAAMSRNYWGQNESINIAFVNGSDLAKNKVKEIAKQWQNHINLKFVYIDDIYDADVKIGFTYNGDRANWSYLGNECLDAWSYNDPTMNIFLNDVNSTAEVNSEDFEGTVLRLYGHMLGLLYEHQGDKSRIKLDPEKTYSYFRPFGWSEENIDDYILKLYNSRQTYKSTDYDENSIMNLYIPSHLISKPADIKATNRYITKLSDQDKTFINSIYPKLLPDPYEPGQEGSTYLVIPTGFSGAYGLLGWNYDTNTRQEWGVIEKTYKTIGVGEYIWTAENLKLKYWNLWATLYEFMNHTQAKINRATGTNNVYTVQQFDDVFGTWTNCYQEARSYKTNFKFYKTKGGEEIKGFDLPDSNDILQLIGQMPVNHNNLYYDIADYLYANKAAVKMLSKGTIPDQYLTFNTPYIENTKNISKLNITPLGYKGNHPDDSGIHHGFGYAFGLQMKQDGRVFCFGDAQGIIVNAYLYHFCSTRYCRQLKASERGYELYVDEVNDEVVVKGSNQSAAGLTVLPKGLERGIALRYKNGQQNIVTESWSTIKEEAKKIRSSIQFQ